MEKKFLFMPTEDRVGVVIPSIQKHRKREEPGRTPWLPCGHNELSKNVSDEQFSPAMGDTCFLTRRSLGFATLLHSSLCCELEVPSKVHNFDRLLPC